MTLFFTNLPDHTSSACESIVEHIERNYPTFVQTSGQSVRGTYYLLNTPLWQHSVRSDAMSVLMRVDQLGKRSSNAIGEIGCTRFNSFLTYEDGWDGSDAKRLSLASVAVLEVFVANYDEFTSEPSLFLTRKGNLKLGWEDFSGRVIEIEFMPASFKYYIEQSDEEGSIRLADIKKLANKLRSIQNAATTV
jgi:hypothetical protein